MIQLHDRRIVLVGGAGFIGHNLALALARGGAVVSIIDGLHVNNLLSFVSADCDRRNQDLYLAIINERLELLKSAGIALYIQDAREQRALAKRIDDLQPQVLIHLAGVSHAQQSNSDPGSAFEHTLRTLEYSLDCVRGHVEHFIYFSSSMVYGHFSKAAVTEQTPCNPLGIYGALKYAGERIVIAHHQVFDVPYTIVRPSALYGERCVSRRVVQVFVENVLQRRDLTVHGDGTERLDFTYIDDVVHGVVRAIQHEAAKNEIFNLAYGCSRSISDLIGLLQEQHSGFSVVYQSRGRLTPQRGTLCIDKARALIGYEPGNPLETGLRKYVRWFGTLGDLQPMKSEAAVSTIAPAAASSLQPLSPA